MQLHDYLRLARRNLALLLLLPLLLGALAWFYSSSKPEQFRASALVLLHPNDPNENVASAGGQQTRYFDMAAFAQSQLAIIGSPGVAQRAADLLPGSSVGRIRGASTAIATRNSTVLNISCTSTDNTFVAPCADAVANGYIASRKAAAIAGLQVALDNVDKQIVTAKTELDDLAKKADKDRFIKSSTLGGKVLPADVLIDPTLQATIDATTAQYKALLERQQDLGININLRRGEAELISKAQRPLAPFAPTPSRTAALGVMLGLLAAAAIAVGRDQLDTRIRDAAALELASGLPVLTRIPTHAKAGADATYLPMVSDTFSAFAERVRELRTSIRFLGATEELRSIVVTSSVPSEGKSIVAANLAAAFAQSGVRVLLVSADLRRPRLDTVFGAELGGLGLTDLITDLAVATRDGFDVDIAEALATSAAATQVDGLYVLRAGTIPPNPNEIVGSATMRRVLDTAREVFDMIIIDSPPLVAVSDAMVLGAFADGVLLVASARRSDRRLVAQSVAQLRASGLRIVGAVLNRAASRGAGYGYGYGYGYSTKAGYAPQATKPARRRGRGAAPAVLATQAVDQIVGSTVDEAGHVSVDRAATQFPSTSDGYAADSVDSFNEVDEVDEPSVDLPATSRVGHDEPRTVSLRVNVGPADDTRTAE
jgi:capsular exopolysaccharide synthesis family protein